MNVTKNNPSLRKHLALVGLMGSGKSTIAALVSQRLACPCIDLDHMLVTQAGKPITQIFEEDGEAVFRQWESKVLQQALASSQASVLATGGGIVLSADNRRLLAEQAWVVWLDASPELLFSRIGNDQNRPLLANQGLAVLQDLAAKRQALYAECAHLRIHVAGQSTTQLVAQLVDVLPAFFKR